MFAGNDFRRVSVDGSENEFTVQLVEFAVFPGKEEHPVKT